MEEFTVGSKVIVCKKYIKKLQINHSKKDFSRKLTVVGVEESPRIFGGISIVSVQLSDKSIIEGLSSAYFEMAD